MQTKKILDLFKEKARHAIEAIKKIHNCSPLHIFPAMPVSASIEMGRLWLPKADMPFVIYDKNTIIGEFVKAIEIKNTF